MPHIAQWGAVRREPSMAAHIPYAVQVADSVVRTAAGDYLQVVRLAGVSFESADDIDLNAWHERLNGLWRNLASPNLALWSHLIRRRESSAQRPSTGSGFATQLARRYQHRLATETLRVNELYLSVVYRPVIGVAPGVLSRMLARTPQHDTAGLQSFG